MRFKVLKVSKLSFIAVLCGMLFSAPAAFAEDSPEELRAGVDRICAHLAAHAQNYKKDDAAHCKEMLPELLAKFPIATAEKCILSFKPVTEEQLMGCVSPRDSGGTVISPVSSLSAALGTKVCAYLEGNATDYDKKDAKGCEEGIGEVSRILGEDKFITFAGCVMGNPKPSKSHFKDCMGDSGPSASTPNMPLSTPPSTHQSTPPSKSSPGSPGTP